MILNVFLVSDIGVCESTFSAVLKPHRHNPDCRDVTAIRKGHGSIPTAHTRHDELFSLSLFFFIFFSWLHELPSWCVPSHYWWASTLVRRQDTGEKERIPVCFTVGTFSWLSLCLLFVSVQKVNRLTICRTALSWSGYSPDDRSLPVENEVKSFCSIFCFFPRPSTLKLWPCGHR